MISVIESFGAYPLIPYLSLASPPLGRNYSKIHVQNKMRKPHLSDRGSEYCMINIQNPLSYEMEYIHRFHDNLISFLIPISFITMSLLYVILNRTFTDRRKVESDSLEIFQTVLPGMILIFIRVPSLRLLYLMDGVISDTVNVKVVGRQWYWQYDYPSNREYDSYLIKRDYRLLDTDNRLLLPTSRTTQLLISAADVLHSWSLPTLAAKADAVPGRVNKLTLTPKHSGVFYGQCREICGSNHRFIPIAIECFNCYYYFESNEQEVKIYVGLFIQTFSVLLSVAFFTLMERKVLGHIQTRIGPNKPGQSGLFVPFADAIKLSVKETNFPSHSMESAFFFSPFLSLLIPLILWVTFPTIYPSLIFNYSLLWFVCVSSLGVYSLLLSGWGRNRIYAFMGGVRAVAQSISYEVSLTLIIMHYVLFYYYRLLSSKLVPIGIYLFVPIILLLVTSLAEANRSPFDFSEGESELVRGFNTEYRSIPFLILFLSEYMSIVFLSTVVSLIYNISRFWDLILFVALWAYVFIWRRGTLPRLRYDQLMFIAWKSFLPFSLVSLALVFFF